MSGGAPPLAPAPFPLAARRVLVLIPLLTIAAAALLPFLSFDGRLDVMLPDRSGARATLEFLREVQISDKILVTLSTADGRADPDGLIAAADRLLARLDPALASPLAGATRPAELAADLARLAHSLPEWLDEGEIAALEARLTPDGISAALRDLTARLHKPEGLLLGGSARADPLDLNGVAFRKIQALVQAFGYRARPHEHHLMDPDKRHLLLVLHTPVPITDAAAVRRLVPHLREALADVPPAIRTRLVCGHLHTFGNEQVIRRDVQVTAVVAVLLFAVLFLAVYRDPRAMLIVAIPFAAALPALAAAALLFGTFSLMVMGFGSVLVGIAVDYGIHAYVAARGPEPDRILRAVFRPVALAAATTLCVFGAFLFSRIPAYRQLGAFAALGVALSFGYAFLLIPPLFKRRTPGAAAGRPILPLPRPARPSPGRRAVTLVLFPLLVLAAAGPALRLRLDPDLTKLDGTPPEILREEQETLAIWGGGESRSAILAVEAGRESDALLLNDRLARALVERGVEGVVSLAPVFPSPATRQVRRAAWQALWARVTPDQLEARLREQGDPLGFDEHAFDPFLKSLRDSLASDGSGETEPIRFLQPLRDRFVLPGADSVRILTFIPDTEAALREARELQAGLPTLRIASPREFGTDLSRDLSREITRLSVLAAGLILLLCLVIMRRPGMILPALLPAATGVLAGFTAMALTGSPPNTANLIAGIVVFGLCVDYGICTVYARRHGAEPANSRAILLSAVTTVLGAAVLLLARHPALFSIGVTLCAGVAAGWLCAWLVLPALFDRFPALSPRARLLPLLLLPVLGLAGCATPAPFPDPAPFPAAASDPGVPGRFAARLAPRFEQVNSVTFHIGPHSLTGLGSLVVDREARTFAIACMNPFGVKLFEIAGDSTQTVTRFILPELAERGDLATAIATDLRRAYFDLTPPPGAPGRVRGARLVFAAVDSGGVTEFRYAGPDGRLAEKVRVEKKRVRWSVAYRGFAEQPDGWLPLGLHIENPPHRYRLVIRQQSQPAPPPGTP